MWEMDVSREDTPFGKPTCDTFTKGSTTARAFNVFPLDHKSPSQVPMWDEVSRDSPFVKPTVTHRNVITPTGRSRTGHSKHSKTRMPNVMDVHTHISPCTNVVKSTVTTTELSLILILTLTMTITPNPTLTLTTSYIDPDTYHDPKTDPDPDPDPYPDYNHDYNLDHDADPYPDPPYNPYPDPDPA